MSTKGKIRSFIGGLDTIQSLKENPLGTIIDIILTCIVGAFVGNPLAAHLVVRYKKQILFVLAGFLILIIGIPVLVFVSFFHYLSHPPQGITQGGGGLQGVALYESLQGYREEGFTDTQIPAKNPLGNTGLLFSVISFDYHQEGYAHFDGIHKGTDLVPSDFYYAQSKAFTKTNRIIIFATMNGTVKYYVDEYGSNTVEVTNTQGTIKTIFMHLDVSFVSTGQGTKAGEPIGVMGNTGISEGTHLHYEIRQLRGNQYVDVDPKTYLL